MTKLLKATTGFIAFFMLIPGTVKFVDPFKTFFTTQIANSQMPFPTLSYWAGQLGEISMGLLLFALVFFWNRFPKELAIKAFYFGHMVVGFIMLVSLYVHAHPDVPAEVLPFEKKFPLLSIIMLCLIGINTYLINKNKN